jgi:maleylacetoacetate isomerase/maleylpyruvate isomerase
VRLYGYWRSSATYRVRIALALKGVDYDYVPVNLREGEQRAEDYLRINPAGLVPTLFAEDGTRLVQSSAIIEYLEESRPAPPLLPTRPAMRAHARAIAATIACEAQPFGNLRILNYLTDDLGLTDEKKAAFLNRWPGGALRAVEAVLKNAAGAFCIGDEPGLADIFLVPQVYAARRFGIDIGGCDTILKIVENCERLEAFRRAHPDNQPDAPMGS